jgi:V8-like Glu-specific endopeptidase
MLSRRGPGFVLLALVALALPATALALKLRAQRRPARSRHIAVSTTSQGVAAIGPLYGSAGATQHGCTASVVHSPGGNTLITAAHCVSGGGVGMVFAPGQHGADAPHGRWTVTSAHVEPKWVTRQDPHADVAFLTVAPRTIDGVSKEIEQVTGSYRLGSTAVRGQRVTVTGYPAGATNNPITCAARIYLTETFPSFDCHGYVDGTSGSPWLRATRHGLEIVGIIGGLNQGGCYEYTSYSSPLGRDARDAYRRAADDAPADVAPQPGGDGC